MKRSRIFLISAVIVTAFIFSNSLQSADTSSDISEGLLAKLFDIFPFLEGVITHALIRKMAHFAEFFAQGTFLSLSAVWSKTGFKQNLPAVGFSGLLTACCDELLQTFSVGRSPQVTDIFIDFSGTLFSVAVVMLILALRRSKQ